MAARRARVPALLALLVLAACLLACALAAPMPLPKPFLDVTNACRCTREFNAVCGNDGQTYSNKCLLECARAQGSSRMGQALSLVKYGQC